MLSRIAVVAVAATNLAGCSMLPYYGQVKAVADTGIAAAVKDRQGFNDKKLVVNLAALCDSSVGAVNRYPDPETREFIHSLCGGDGQGITTERLAQLLRTLEQMKAPAS